MSETLVEIPFMPTADATQPAQDEEVQQTAEVQPVPAAPAGGQDEALPESDDAEDDRLERCERRIGYVFRKKELLREALTHASCAEHRLASNERLEFLGDAILGAVVCELLFRLYPEYMEGDLTKIKSAVVSRQSCAKISDALGLQEFLVVGKGVSAASSIPDSLLADVFESLIAAIHLDGGAEAARRFVEGVMEPEIELVATGERGGNFKSLLQQVAQCEFNQTPTYQLLDEKGPDHRKCFKIAAHVGQIHYQPAWGRNKKEAEQRAACNALAEIKGEPAIFPSD
jgi:ribonuclease III